MPPAPIYLDHNATAPMLPEVAEAVRGAALRYPGNPASQHELGRQARRALEAARTRIGELLGARTTGMDADQVIFTSGGTESNNLALCGLLQPRALPGGKPEPSPRSNATGGGPRAEPGAAIARLLISAIEHPSVARTAESIASHGVSLSSIDVRRNGVICLENLRRLLDENTSGPLPLAGRVGEGVGNGYTLQSPLPGASARATALRTVATGDRARLVPPHQGEGTGGKRISQRSQSALRHTLVSIMLASNETGVIQPVAQAAAACHRHGALVHTDATQAVGKIPVNFQELGVDALTATAHKFHGPLGIGVLVLRHGVALEPALYGGFQQAALRPGTESVALAVGMQTALELWRRETDERRERMTALRDRFERTILGEYPGGIVIGAEAPRLPHTSNIAFVGLDRQALAMALDLAGVACSTGSACASGSSEPSPTLLAMALPQAVISSSIRFSLGAQTTVELIDEAARRILGVCNRLRREK